MNKALIDPNGVTVNVIFLEDGFDYPLQAGWTLGDPLVHPLPTISSVPESVTPRQLKLALYKAGILDTIESFVANQNRPAQISWDEAIEFLRGDPMLDSMAAAFGLTAAQVDAIFVSASAL